MLKNTYLSIAPLTNKKFPDISGLLARHYQQKVSQALIRHDEAQIVALNHLQQLLERLLAVTNYEQKPLTRKLLSAKPEKCRSLYIYGGVGRGKSMLMELFYEACPIDKKRRVHFNTFMLEVHAFTHQCHQQQSHDVIPALARHIRDSVTLLCFDEFHVTDIADAMILGRLFSQLFELGVVVVMTSNRHPNELYQGGLQRDQFLFFIKILQGEAEIIELISEKDFRLDYSPSFKKTYYFPLDHRTQDFIQRHYQSLTHSDPITPKSLKVLGRDVLLSSAHGNVALASFHVLCVDSLGSADYLEIADQFSTLMITSIPKLTAEKRNEAKRFVTLIDALYEHKVKLICTAEVPATALYTEGDGSFEFGRTVSRLIEMQSEAYLQTPHIRRL
ncbi:MAG: cell division protein ZapE [Methylococcaceae bacterium]|nr:cell division protein ZapE [Methylococcaceae bacterium]